MLDCLLRRQAQKGISVESDGRCFSRALLHAGWPRGPCVCAYCLAGWKWLQGGVWPDDGCTASYTHTHICFNAGSELLT